MSITGIFACTTPTEHHTADTQAIKNEIISTEKAFEKMASEKGIAEAFYFYADSTAVISRGNQLHQGKEAIKAFCIENIPEGVTLEWTPTFVDVAMSGDLGYSYGNYTYTVTDSTGNSQSLNGIFHTVWKKQPDGSWKFVWD